MTLRDFFEEHSKAAVAFSGGVNSSYLLYAAKRAECDITAYYLCSQLQPAFELRDAQKLARELGVSLRVLECDMLAYPEITENRLGWDYRYKYVLMETILNAARADGFDVLLEGAVVNTDDAEEAGRRVARKLGILAPLRMSGLKRKDVRALSKVAGLFTHNKPAYESLAASFPQGEPLTPIDLLKVEAAQHVLFEAGLYDFRLRIAGNSVLVQIPHALLQLYLQRQQDIEEPLSRWFTSVHLDANMYEPE